MAWPLSQDYNEAVQNPRTSFSDPELRDGQPTLNPLGLPMPRSGNFADVYEFVCPATQGRWAVKCFTRQVAGLRERYSEISRHLQDARLPFTVDFQYLEQGIRIRGQWYPILKMRWVEGLLLNEFVRDNLDKPALLQSLSQIWVRMARRLREADAAHCDLQHGNVLLVPGAKNTSLAVKLIDYDGMFVPALARSNSGEVGHANYQHPSRAREGTYSLEVDRVPLLVVATALRGLIIGGRGLWDRHDNGDNLLFKESDLRAPPRSAVFNELAQLSDPLLQTLVGHLSQACQCKLESAPLLHELLPEEKPPAPARTPVRAQSAVTTTPTASQPVDWDFTESAAPVRRRRKQGGVPVWSWVAGGAAVVVLAAVAIFFATRKGDDTPKEPAVAETRPDSKRDKRPLKDRDKPPPDGNIKPPPKEKDPVKPPPIDGSKPPDVTTESPRPAESEKQFTNSIGMKLVQIPAGKFLMGSPKDEDGRFANEEQHQVEITRPFYMGKYVVTVGQFRKFVESANYRTETEKSEGGDGYNPVKNPPFEFGKQYSWKNNGGEQSDDHPVVNITWNDAQAFCDWLSRKEGKTYRLPTEAEWEYACRAGTKTRYYCGDDVRALKEVANVADASYARLLNTTGGVPWDDGCPLAAPVGRFKPNAFGLFDMHGNVHQWCADWHDDDYPKHSPVKNPPGPDSSPSGARVVRGGSFRNDWRHCRSAARTCKWSPSSRYLDLGFRVVCVQSRSAPEGEAVAEEREPLRFEGQTKRANCVAFSPDGRLLATGHDEPPAVRLWDTTTGKVVHEFSGLTTRADRVAFSADGKKVRTNSGWGASRAWDVQSHRDAGELSSGWYLSPGSRYRVSIDFLEERIFLRVWSRDEKTEYHRFPLDDNTNVFLSYSADQSRLAFIGHRGTLHVFDLPNKRLVCKFGAGGGSARSYSASISPDGKSVLVSYANGDIRLWDLEEQKIVRTLSGHTTGLRSMVFSHDGKRAFSGANDGTVYEWDVTTGKALARLKGPTSEVMALTLSADGRQLAAATPDGIFVWKVPPGETVVVKPPVDPPMADKDKRRPIPDKEALTAAEKELRQSFKAEYAAKTLEQWQQLAGKLRDYSNEIRNKPALHYVALRDSRDAWILSGNLAWSLRMAMTINRDYRVNPLEVRCEGLEAAKKSRDIGHIQRDLAVTSLALLEQAIDEDNYDVAARFLALARQTTTAVRETDLIRKASIASEHLDKTRKEYAKVKPALEKLATNPDDRAACLAVGTFLCCCKDDWEEGLPLLKKSDDSKLSRLAEKDLAAPNTGAARTAVGLGWLAQSVKANDLLKAACHRRAAYWLREALPELNGKEKTSVDAHLRSLYRSHPGLQEPWPHLVIDDAVVSKDSFRLNDWGTARTKRSYRGGVEVSTKRAYKGGVEVNVVARTEKNNLRLCAGRGAAVVFNWENNPGGLRLYRPDNLSVDWGTEAGSKPSLLLKPKQWYTIRWRLTTSGMKLWVDDELVFEEDHLYDLSAREPVAIESFDSAIDVKSFVVKRIRER